MISACAHRTGDPVEHFYIVSRGELSVEGEEGVTLGTIGEGEALGEISLLAGKRRHNNSSAPRVNYNTGSTTTTTQQQRLVARRQAAANEDGDVRIACVRGRRDRPGGLPPIDGEVARRVRVDAEGVNRTAAQPARLVFST